MDKNIYEFVTNEETAYNALPVMVTENYDWSMPKHINTTVLYKNSQYISGKDENKPFKNIIRPILNLQYRAEGFDVKDIVLFVNDSEKYYMSFLVSKYHEKWARKNKIDTFIDELVESYVDFGGTLVKNVNSERPEVVKLQTIAFCDQTDLLGGPVALKHFYSPSQLLQMQKQGWGDTKHGATASCEEAILLSEEWKKNREATGVKSKTPGKYVEVYEVHGYFPDEWLKDEETPIERGVIIQREDPDVPSRPEITYSLQMHIIMLSKIPGSDKPGVTLFKGKEKESIFKLLLRDPIYGRALGLGGAEELFEPQVWVNYDVIRMKGMLDMASKMIFQTADTSFATRNKISDLENGEILVHGGVGMELTQINTQPVNLEAFTEAIKDWEDHAQTMGSASNDGNMGEDVPAGRAFDTQQLITQNADSLHEYRQGKISTFVDEIYKDWIIPYIVKEIESGKEFAADLDLQELQTVCDNVVTLQANSLIKEMILSGQEIQPQVIETYKQQVQAMFMKGGNKRFLTILDGEMKDAPVDVEVNIAGKQKDLKGLTDKLVNIFKTILANPSVLDDPRAAKIFNKIIEYSGMDPIDFSGQAPQTSNGSGSKGSSPSESINFADLPPDGQVQMAKQAGITISPPAPKAPPGAAPPQSGRKPVKQTVTA